MFKKLIKYTFLISIIISSLARISFAMQEGRMPDWAKQLESLKPENSIPSYGEEYDAAVDLIASAYINAGGGNFLTGLYGFPPVIFAMLFGGGYYDGLAILAKTHFEKIQKEAKELKVHDYLVVYAIIAMVPLDLAGSEQQFFYVTNKYRREYPKNDDSCNKYFNRLNNILMSLEKPNKPLSLFRYMEDINVEELRVGQEWNLAFSSCSLHETKTLSFAGKNKKGIKLIINEISPEFCRELLTLSPLKDKEDEVMILTNCEGKIVKIEREIKNETGDEKLVNICCIIVVEVNSK